MKNSLLSRRQMLTGTAMAATALLCPLPLWAARDTHRDLHTRTSAMLGTLVTITVAGTSPTQAEEAMGQAFARAASLENIFSRHQSATALSTLNSQGKLLNAPTELVELLSRASRIHGLTAGAFDISVAPVLDCFRSHSNPRGRMALDARELAEARSLVAAQEIYLAQDHVRLGRTGMALTLDGIAKGHIADVMGQVLSTHGVHNYLVNAGGDICAHGTKAPGTPWLVGVQAPGQQQASTTVPPVALSGAIATSGSYEIYYDATREHHHLIDPRAKASPQHILSASVTAPTTLEADALATALSVMPPADALRLVRSLPGRECCLMARDGRVLLSAGWGKA